MGQDNIGRETDRRRGVWVGQNRVGQGHAGARNTVGQDLVGGSTRWEQCGRDKAVWEGQQNRWRRRCEAGLSGGRTAVPFHFITRAARGGIRLPRGRKGIRLPRLLCTVVASYRSGTLAHRITSMLQQKIEMTTFD
jgi:hypothetical protein